MFFKECKYIEKKNWLDISLMIQIFYLVILIMNKLIDLYLEQNPFLIISITLQTLCHPDYENTCA